jgi:hypothetical protein
MPHILTEYSKHLEAEPSEVVVNKHFYPVIPDDYIVIYNEQNIDAKCYNYYGLFCDLIKSQLKKCGVTIVVIGSQENLTDRADYAYPNLSFRKNCYIVSKAKALISVDNVMTQYASSQKVPVISLYGNIYSSITTPFWSSKNKKADMEPDWSGKPCMSLHDPEQSIDKIKAEDLASSTISVLKKNYKEFKAKTSEVINFKTKLINKNKDYTIDVIPTNYVDLPIFKDQVLNLRLDKAQVDYASFVNYCSNHKCSIIIKDTLIQLEPIKHLFGNIESIKIITTKKSELIPSDYFSAVRSLGSRVDILVSNEEILDDIRFEYFDESVDFYDPPQKKPDNISEKDYFMSFKVVVQGDKIYNSTYNWKNSIDNGDNVVDNADYWEELDYFYIYEQDRH